MRATKVKGMIFFKNRLTEILMVEWVSNSGQLESKAIGIVVKNRPLRNVEPSFDIIPTTRIRNK